MLRNANQPRAIDVSYTKRQTEQYPEQPDVYLAPAAYHPTRILEAWTLEYLFSVRCEI